MNTLYPKKITQLLLCASFLSATTFSARAASINPKAQQIVEHSVKTYRSLQSYQDTAVQSSVTPAGKHTTRQVISWKAPRFLNVATISGTHHLIDNYDGTHYNYTSVDDSGAFWSNEPLPDTSYGRQVLLQYQPVGMFFTPFLAGENPFQEPFGIPMSSIILKNPGTLGGVKVDTIVATPKDDSRTHFTYLIGQKDHLIRRITVQSVTVDGDKYHISETHSNIKTNLTFAPGTFTFHAPANTPLKHPQVDGMGQTLNVGDAAPVINAKNIKGNSVTLEKYKGKVLLVDFWASWCVPCLRSMPYLKSLRQKYHGQGFDILGISSDIKLSDLNKFIKEESIPWQQIFDPEGSAAEPYNVMYIPYSVLIGRDGKIIAVNKDKLLLDSAIRNALKQ